MSADRRAYLDTSALAKWYLNEANSEAFVSYLKGLDSAVVSSLTRTEVRSLLSQRRRIGKLTAELKTLLFAAFVEDLDRGWLQLHPIEDDRFHRSRSFDQPLSRSPLAHARCPASRRSRPCRD